MVKRSHFLDIKPKPNPVRKARTGTTATVTEVLENGRVEVQFGEGEDAQLATGRASGGVTAVGAEVPVRIDPVTGKLVSVGDPAIVPEGATLVPTGTTGETALAAWDVAGEVAEAQGKLDQDMEDLAADLADANKMIDDAGELIETVVKPGLEAAQGDADKAAQDAALAMVTAQGIIKAGPDDPGHEKGRLWIQTKDGLPVGMKISDGENWVPYALFAEDIFVVGEDGTVHIRDGVITTPMLEVTADLWTAMLEVAGDATIGGNLIGLNTITAPNIVASEELSAKIGRFLEVSTDQLTAGDAKITGDLLAENISGVNLYGVTVDGGEFWIRGVDKADVVVLHETFETGTPAIGVFNGWAFYNAYGNASANRDADGISGNCARADYPGASGTADPVFYFTPTTAQQAATVSGEVTVTVPMRYSGGMQKIAASARVKFADGKYDGIAMRVSKTVDGWDYWVCTVPHGAMLTRIWFTCVSSTTGWQSVWLDEVTLIKNNTTNASMHLYRDVSGEPLIDITALDGTKTTLSGTGLKSGDTEITWEELVDPNKILINNQMYQRSGRLRLDNLDFSREARSLFRCDVYPEFPEDLPAGWSREITVFGGPSSLCWASYWEGANTTSPRIVLLSPYTTSSSAYISWEVKPSV